MLNGAGVRRAGYAPANADVGRRGLHTREVIVHSAAHLFLACGFHGTSIESIAKAAGSSRATIYQYFQDKDDIYRELVARCVPAMLDHAAALGRLGPDVDGIHHLQAWLQQCADLYDEHTVVLLGFPGVGSGTDVSSDRHAMSAKYIKIVSERIRQAAVVGVGATDAAEALVRIAYMVNLHRYRGMFGLPDAAVTTASLTIALQLLLFPDTPRAVLDAVAVVPAEAYSAAAPVPATQRAHAVVRVDPPVRSDIIAASSALFAADGYVAVGMDDIARAANISRATLYRHFRTKSDILSDLTQRAVSGSDALVDDLGRMVTEGCTRDRLGIWLGRYLHFHRVYGGVIRTWYDGGLSKQLMQAVSSGLGPFEDTVIAFLSRYGVAPGIDIHVGAAIFLSVLGRLSEMTLGRDDQRAAEFLLVVLTRALDLVFAEGPATTR